MGYRSWRICIVNACDSTSIKLLDHNQLLVSKQALQYMELLFGRCRDAQFGHSTHRTNTQWYNLDRWEPISEAISLTVMPCCSRMCDLSDDWVDVACRIGTGRLNGSKDWLDGSHWIWCEAKPPLSGFKNCKVLPLKISAKKLLSVQVLLSVYNNVRKFYMSWYTRLRGHTMLRQTGCKS